MKRALLVGLSAVTLVLTGCQDNPTPPAASPTTDATSAAPSESPSSSPSAEPSGRPFTTEPSDAEGSDLGSTTVSRIRSGSNQGFDRLVLDLKGPAPAWQAEYVDRLVNDGSGEPAPINGVRNLLVVVQATGYDVNTGDPVFQGPNVARPRLTTLKAWSVTGDFEGQFSVGLALNSDAPYRVFALTKPSRLVIDVQHP